MSDESIEWFMFFCDGAYWAFLILNMYILVKLYSKVEDIEEKIDNWQKINR